MDVVTNSSITYSLLVWKNEHGRWLIVIYIRLKVVRFRSEPVCRLPAIKHNEPRVKGKLSGKALNTAAARASKLGKAMYMGQMIVEIPQEKINPARNGRRLGVYADWTLSGSRPIIFSPPETRAMILGVYHCNCTEKKTSLLRVVVRQIFVDVF